MAVFMVSCNKENAMTGPINKVEDLYTVPADATKMSELTNAQSTWSTDRRYFDLSFGTALTTQLVGYDALLTPGQYVLGADEIGKAVLAKTTVNGKAAKQGFITVGCRDSKYTITAQIDGEVLAWTGTLPFVADPAPVALSVVLDAKANAGEVTTLTMNLATEGISQELDMTTYQTVWKGEGGYLALDLNTGDKYLVDGTYKACAEGGVVNTGEFGIGWDPGDLYGIGWVFSDWGTCWWDVKDGAATATKITDGLVTVSSREENVEGKDVTIWTIYWGKNYPKEYVFEGQIPALTKPKKPAGPVVPDMLYTEEVTPGDVEKHAITITDKDKNILAYLELLMASGETNYEGSYPSTGYASQPGQMCDGYDGGSWGEYTWEAGGSYYMENGEKKMLYKETATVTVTKIAEGAYNFACEFFDYNCAGPDYVPGEGGDFDGVVLTKFTNFQSYAQMNMNMVGIEMATDGIVATPGWWGKNYSGDGNYLKLELYAENDVVEPGEYKPNAEAGGALNAFEFNMGYDGAYGASGTAWYTLTADNPSYEYITDGTVTITKDGDNYTVIVKSSTVNVKYVGPLSE